MINVENTENDVQVGGVICYHNTWARQGENITALVSDLREQKRAVRNDAGPYSLEPEYQAESFSTQGPIEKRVQ